MSVIALQRRKLEGVSLTEVLVAVVVISVGLLGVAALQLSTLQNNRNAMLRTQVTALADDILDRMRANRTNATAYVRDWGDAAPATGATQAQQDMFEWYSSLQAHLPPDKNGNKADGKIDVTIPGGSSNPLVTVQIKWGEHVGNDALSDTSLTFVTSTGI